MKANLPHASFATKLTAAGLVGCAVAIWIQWLSGDPSYPKFPPGPVFFIAVAAIVLYGVRWWWTPLLGSLLALLVTSGWFARLPKQMQRLSHPGSLGHFAPGIFIGTLGMVILLLLTDVAGLVATIQNYRTHKQGTENSKMALRFFGAIFVLMGAVVLLSRLHSDPYHNGMHMVWGAMALAASFLSARTAKLFCIGSGLFYLMLAILGLTLGDAAMSRAWHAGPMLLYTGDHVFHLVLGSIFLAFGIPRLRKRHYQETLHAAGDLRS